MILKIHKSLFFIIIVFFLVSCGGGWEEFESALGGQKKATTDEYLIRSKDPLVLPPDYKKLPLPDSTPSENKDVNSVEKILSEKNTSTNNKVKKSELEKMIEEELRKRN